MAGNPKPYMKSTTTQNVAAGTLATGAGTGATAIGVIAALRSIKPDLLPWSQDQDTEIVVSATAIYTILSTVIVPFISRKIAFWRNPEKKPAQ